MAELILLKTIVDNEESQSPVFTTYDDESIIAKGSTEDYGFKVVYKPNNITIYFGNPYNSKELGKTYEQDHNRTESYTHPISTFFWNILHNNIPEWNEEVFNIFPLTIIFYLPYNTYIGYDKDCSYRVTIHGHDFYWKSNGNAKMVVDRGNYFVFARNIAIKVNLWKNNIYKRNFNQVMTQLKYHPGLGIEYHIASEEYTKYESKHILQ